MGSVLNVQDLTVCYGTSRDRLLTAVSSVSFALARGETLGILGESGSGKTTLALALLGMLPRNASVKSGVIAFQGANLAAQGEQGFQKVRGVEVSLIHQEAGWALNPVLRVGQQVAEVLLAHQNLSAKQAREKSRELLAQVGLAKESRIDEAFPHQLSGGQRQRVVIAQAIACGPTLIIADEPTTALDAAVQMEIIALLRNLQQQLNLAVILITHNPGVLTPIAHRILVMYAGRIVEEGPTRDVLQNPLHPYTRGLLQCGLAALPTDSPPRPLAAIPGEPPNLTALPAGCPFAPRCSERMDVCDIHAPGEMHPGNLRRVWCFKYE
jgi:oligopeptide/dipeptide ABC transporter ATP-binding protein